MPREPPRVAVYPNAGGVVRDLAPNDVLSGRTNRARFHPGNVALRTVLADGYRDEYEFSDKNERPHVAARLVEEVRAMDPPGRFLQERRDGGGYAEIGDEKAWKKVASVLRDAINSDKGSNNRPPPVKKKVRATKLPARKRARPSNNNNLPNGNGNKPPPVQGKASLTKVSVPRRGSSSKSGNLHNAASSLPDRGRLVIARPSSKSFVSREREDADEGGQWPRYNQHCRTYGFAVEVEQRLTTTASLCNEGVGSGVAREGGPRKKMMLVDEDESANGHGKATRVPLRCVSERLIVRRCYNSSSVTLHPELSDGDIIQTLDGKPNPTFAILYDMMCQREKLVLEVVNENSGMR